MIKINYGNYKKYFYISVSFKTHCKRLEEGCFVNILRPFFTSISRLHSLVSSTVFPPFTTELRFYYCKEIPSNFFFKVHEHCLKMQKNNLMLLEFWKINCNHSTCIKNTKTLRTNN